MKAFISYSLVNNDLFLVSLLAKELQNRGINSEGTIHTSYHNADISVMTDYNIRTCDLFIGIFSGDGGLSQNEQVYDEWKVAVNHNKARIFLIENTVKINPEFKEKYLVFDRYNPNVTLQKLEQFITNKEKQKKNKENLALVIGGAALIALIAALSKD